MRLFFYKLIAVCVLMACSSCASSGPSYDDAILPIPDSTTSVSAGDLRIAALDLIQVEVYGVESLNGTYQVDFDGQMKLPLVGEIDVVGMTPGELSFYLEERYEEQYLQDPDISVSIAESAGRRITVDGAVRSPGMYPISGEITLMQAVALGGGTASTANTRKVVVFRQIGGKRHAAAFDLVSIRTGKQEDPEIFGNDVIVVDGSNLGETYDRAMRSIPLIALFLAL